MRRLVDRDRKELDLDDLEAAFGADPAAAATPSSAADADSSGEAATSFMVNSSQAGGLESVHVGRVLHLDAGVHASSACRRGKDAAAAQVAFV